MAMRLLGSIGWAYERLATRPAIEDEAHEPGYHGQNGPPATDSRCDGIRRGGLQRRSR
ncbi:hypothetical protein NITHO_3050012 [Nitrolancea hollandica Lb]|uniref:Uncharacterized protein n=1 Tax=Nitrolancea hollandica Lb TaxID=1129897 RepID=I4EHA5_9BACT|nr:hypothetical protein NITHO_3050012 [Nitrolancea hollandica Lb]